MHCNIEIFLYRSSHCGISMHLHVFASQCDMHASLSHFCILYTIDPCCNLLKHFPQVSFISMLSPLMLDDTQVEAVQVSLAALTHCSSPSYRCDWACQYTISLSHSVIQLCGIILSKPNVGLITALKIFTFKLCAMRILSSEWHCKGHSSWRLQILILLFMSLSHF